MAEANVLYLDTATDTLMIGVSRGEEMRVRISRQSTSQRYHSAVIIPAIREALEQSGLSPGQLHAMAMHQGPGSFTGVRTGISTARTMGQFLNIPIYALNAFELLAADARARGMTQPVTIILDALRERAYTATLILENGVPRYEQPPALNLLGSWSPPETGSMVVSPGLAGRFSELRPEVLRLDCFTPDLMRMLISQAGDFYRREWAEIKPLYLQEPNITLPRPKIGRY